MSEELRAEEGEAAALRDLDERCAKGAATGGLRAHGRRQPRVHRPVVFAALAPLVAANEIKETNEPTELTKSTTMETAMEAATASKGRRTSFCRRCRRRSRCCHHGGDGGGGGTAAATAVVVDKGGVRETRIRVAGARRATARLPLGGGALCGGLRGPSADPTSRPPAPAPVPPGQWRGIVLASEPPAVRGTLACVGHVSCEVVIICCCGGWWWWWWKPRNGLRLPVALHRSRLHRKYLVQLNPASR